MRLGTGTIGVLLGWLFLFLSVALLIPIAFSIYYDDGNWQFFVISSAIGFVLGGGLVWSCVSEPEIGHREGFAIVAFSWLSAAALGALPYYLSGAIPSYLNAYFESMSGFTTTGATILERVEVLGPSLLFWRCPLPGNSAHARNRGHAALPGRDARPYKGPSCAQDPGYCPDLMERILDLYGS